MGIDPSGDDGRRATRSGNHHPNIKGPYGVYETADGGSIMIAQTMQNEAWDALCIFAETFELAIDPRFQTPGQRLGEGLTLEDSAEVRAVLTRAFTRKPRRNGRRFCTINQKSYGSESKLAGGARRRAKCRQRLPDEYLGGRGRHRQDCGHTCENERHAGVAKGRPTHPWRGKRGTACGIGLSAEERRAIEAHATATRESLLAEIAKMKAK